MSEDTKPRLRYSSDGTMIASNDGLKNVISGMGTERDRRTHSQFNYGAGNDIAELEAAYATNWIARQVIDAPVDDATREWRVFSIDEAAEIRKAENAMNLQGVTQEAFKWAGLYGGAGVLLITDQPLDKLLDHKKIKKGSLKRLLVLDRMLITGQDYNVSDPMAANYMLPNYYIVNGGRLPIHHSHFVRAPGAKLPLRLRMINQGWDDSQLRRCMEDIKDAVSAKSGVASLIQEANVDIISKDGLSDILSSGDMDTAVASRYQMFGMMKSMFRLGLLDSTEEYNRHAASFGGLGEILSTLMEWVSGAAEIPMTRLFGVQSKGMGDSGKGDMNNYYNAIRGKQESDYRQFLEAIDKVLIPSALGSMPDDCEFDWNPLSQPSDTELAQQQLAFAQSDDIRLAQGVVRRSQVARKLAEQGVYAIGDDDIDQMETDEKAERDGEDFIPLAGLGGGEPGTAEEAGKVSETDSA
jgi:phage-related protein (TIGR01555 family)